MSKTGNTVSSTIPIALYEAMKEGKAKEGRYSSFGRFWGWSLMGCNGHKALKKTVF